MRITSFILFTLVMAVSFSSCSESEEAQNDLPECIDTRVTNFTTTQATCVGAKIEKYRYQEIIVYSFTDGNCITDGGIAVVDEGCGDICFLGGIASLTECNGEDFASAELLELIWSNN